MAKNSDLSDLVALKMLTKLALRVKMRLKNTYVLPFCQLLKLRFHPHPLPPNVTE